MTPSKAVYLMVLFLAATVFCVEAKANRKLAEVPTNNTRCGPLREGVYLGEYSFPSELGGTDRVLQTKRVVNLVKDGIAYHGTVAGIAFNSQNENVLPRNVPLFNYIWAVFDEETCTLSGAAYNFETALIDAFKFDYDGRVISGEYAVTINETVLFSVLSYARLTPTFE